LAQAVFQLENYPPVHKNAARQNLVCIQPIAAMVKMLVKLSCSLGLLAYGVAGEVSAPVAPPAPVNKEIPIVDEAVPPVTPVENHGRHLHRSATKPNRNHVDVKHAQNRAPQYQQQENYAPDDHMAWYDDEALYPEHYPSAYPESSMYRGMTPEEYRMERARELDALYNERYGYPAYDPYDGYYGDYYGNPYYNMYEDDAMGCDSYPFWWAVLYLVVRTTVWTLTAVFLSMFLYTKWNKTIKPWLKSRNQAPQAEDLELAHTGRNEVLLQQS